MRVLLSACLFLMTAACNVGGDLPAGTAMIEVRDAYVSQPAEGRTDAIAGMHISLKGDARTLIGASTPIATRVELHTLSDEGGIMRMRRVDEFVVSEDAPLSLDRGGNHLMLFGVKKSPGIGDTVNIVLTFRVAEGKEQDVLATAEIVPAGE